MKPLVFVNAGSTWSLLAKSYVEKQCVFHYFKNASNMCVSQNLHQMLILTMFFAIDCSTAFKSSGFLADKGPRIAKAETLRLTMPSGYTRPSTFGVGGFLDACFFGKHALHVSVV